MGTSDLDLLCHIDTVERKEQRKADALNPRSPDPLDASLQTEIACVLASYEESISKGEIINLKFTEFITATTK